MAALGHLPFVLTSTASSMCQSAGWSLFHTSLDSQYDTGVLSKTTVHNSYSSTSTTTNSSSNPGQDILRHLQEAVNLCNGNIKELVNVCNAGAQTAQYLTTSINEISKLADYDKSCTSTNHILSQKLANEYAEAWGQLSVTMKNSIETLQKGVFSTLQDVVANLDNKEKIFSCNLPLFASESNKVLITSLLTMIHLQYEFSLCMCEALFDLVNFNPEFFDLNPILLHESSTNGSNKLSEFLASCLDSLAGLQRHFSESLSSFRKHSSFQSGSDAENTTISTKARPSSNPEIPFRNQSLFSSTDGFPFDCTWSALPSEISGKLLNKSQQMGSQLPPTHMPSFPYVKSLSNQSQAIWSTDSLIDSSWTILEKPTEAMKTLTKDEKQKSVFASQKELQDIIGLLSCQTSNPSSPTSESSITSHYQTTNNETKTSFLWPVPNGNGLLNYESESGFGGTPNLELSKHSKSWPCENDLSSVWNSPITQESSMCNIKPSYSTQSEASFIQCSRSLENSDLIQSYGVNPNAQRLSAIHCNQGRNLRAAKSTSWPIMGYQGQSHVEGQNEFSNKLNDKGNNFFMGIQLVGNDLMASVRQRRHSSGSSFPENVNFQTCSPSVRTKSIDSILMENTCKEITSSSKPDTPGNSQSFSSSSSETQPMMSEGSSLWHFGTLPQGLPPSGVENRHKFKIERKYSLFGQAV